MKKLIISLTVLLLMGTLLNAQNAPSAFGRKDSAYFSKPYPYILPIMGNKVHHANIRLPFPMGIMVNALVGTQNLALSDMALGFGNNTNPTEPNMYDISDIVIFDDISAQTSTYNARFDAWVLPFLNVYGIVGKTKKADINVNLTEPFPLSVTTEVSGTYVGYGIMAAGAVGPLFISADANRTYNYNPRLDEPAKVLIAGLRTGPVFRFKNRPEMNATLWAGVMYSHFNGETVGSIGALELAPNAPAKIDEMQGNLDSWYGNLKPIEQVLYENLYNNLSNGLTGLSDGIENGYIRYSFNKSIEKPWNMLLGGQWQINYRWQLRAEAQLLGDRTAGLFSLNYRFGIRGENWFSK